MKTACDVKGKLAQLVQQNVATPGNDSFKSCSSSSDGLMVVASDEDGVERTFEITVKEADNCNTKTAAVAETACCQQGQPCAEAPAPAPAS